jgi:hypothetical protein
MSAEEISCNMCFGDRREACERAFLMQAVSLNCTATFGSTLAAESEFTDEDPKALIDQAAEYIAEDIDKLHSKLGEMGCELTREQALLKLNSTELPT